MEFFGVGPAELLFLLVLGLIVVGPERLPDMARSAGRLVAWLMAWQQRSPEFQTIQQIRHDMQQEIVDLRDELMRTQKQLANSVQPLQQTVPSLSKDLEKAAEAASRPRSPSPPAAPSSVRGSPVPTTGLSKRTQGSQGSQEGKGTAGVQGPAESAGSAELGGTKEVKPDRSLQNGHTEASPTLLTGESPPAEPAEAEHEHEPVNEKKNQQEQDALLSEVQALRAEMQALKEHLRERGYLAADWPDAPAPSLAIPSREVSSS
jgi:sec-independent protein translocase protein TatB